MSKVSSLHYVCQEKFILHNLRLCIMYVYKKNGNLGTYYFWMPTLGKSQNKYLKSSLKFQIGFMFSFHTSINNYNIIYNMSNFIKSADKVKNFARNYWFSCSILNGYLLFCYFSL